MCATGCVDVSKRCNVVLSMPPFCARRRSARRVQRCRVRPRRKRSASIPVVRPHPRMRGDHRGRRG
eukprot:2156145-Lingulodinium_polyedra.AAC.1